MYTDAFAAAIVLINFFNLTFIKHCTMRLLCSNLPSISICDSRNNVTTELYTGLSQSLSRSTFGARVKHRLSRANRLWLEVFFLDRESFIARKSTWNSVLSTGSLSLALTFTWVVEAVSFTCSPPRSLSPSQVRDHTCSPCYFCFYSSSLPLLSRCSVSMLPFHWWKRV